MDYQNTQTFKFSIVVTIVVKRCPCGETGTVVLLSVFPGALKNYMKKLTPGHYHVQCVTPKYPTFFNKKRQKSGTLWEHLPKRYHFWTIIKQKRKRVGHFGVSSIFQTPIYLIFIAV